MYRVMSCNRFSWESCFLLPDGVYCRVESDTSRKYQKIGVLTNNRLGPLPLYGMRTQPSSSEWYYYTESSQDPPQTLPVYFKERNCQGSYRGCREFNEGDHVNVQGYPMDEFVVSLFKQ